MAHSSVKSSVSSYQLGPEMVFEMVGILVGTLLLKIQVQPGAMLVIPAHRKAEAGGSLEFEASLGN